MDKIEQLDLDWLKGKAPETADNRAKSGISGNKRKKRGVYLRKAGSVRIFLSRVANEVKNGELPPATGNAVANICRVLLQSLEQSDLEERLAKIEDMLLQRKKGSATHLKRVK